MVAFLEKHFEFTTHLSMEECVVWLKAKSTRRSGLFADRQGVLVSFSDEIGGKTFKLDRDWGRNLYAEVHGQLKKNPDGTIKVSGYGQVSLFTFLFTIVFSLGAFFIVYKVPELNQFGLLMIFVNLMLLLVTFINRDDLVALVKETLEVKGR